MEALQDLSIACNKIGSKIPAWTQGGGGNVSVKKNGILSIKASGVRLDEVTPNRGIAQVDLPQFLDKLAKCPKGEAESEVYYADLLKNAGTQELNRPSMETGFHAIFENNWVGHFHSLVSLLIAHHYFLDPSESIKVTEWLRNFDINPVKILPPIRPGLKLIEELRVMSKIPIIILKNHGVILQSIDALEHPGGILEQWKNLEIKFCEQWGYNYLLGILRNDISFEQIQLDAQDFLNSPRRIYFPDSAVFLDRMTSIQREKKGVYQLLPQAFEKDKDAAELCLATSILYYSCPTLEELPPEISIQVGNLPTEKFRTQTGPYSK